MHKQFTFTFNNGFDLNIKEKQNTTVAIQMKIKIQRRHLGESEKNIFFSMFVVDSTQWLRSIRTKKKFFLLIQINRKRSQNRFSENRYANELMFYYGWPSLLNDFFQQQQQQNILGAKINATDRMYVLVFDVFECTALVTTKKKEK